jgi:hypothetical protein
MHRRILLISGAAHLRYGKNRETDTAETEVMMGILGRKTFTGGGRRPRFTGGDTTHKRHKSYVVRGVVNKPKAKPSSKKRK